MKYYIIAGEASGDLHASNLIRELKKQDPSAQIRCWGGDLMQQQGAELVKHYKELAFMGFTEVLMNLRTILKNLDFCKRDILQFDPDVVILVDYPGFNLRIADFAKSKGLKIFYYISPQVWAWNVSRVKKIKKNVDRMFVILPFEKEFFARFDYNVDFTGHPLLDALEQRTRNSVSADTFRNENGLDHRPVVAILPGSRRQEIEKMLPLMVEVTKTFPEYQFVIAGVAMHGPSFYERLMPNTKWPVLFGKTYELLEQSYAAMVTSGTATLETALFGVPQVVCYKGGALSYRIARNLVKVKYISLANLIMDREVVKELIQDDFNAKALSSELTRLLKDADYRNKIKKDYEELHSKLGGPGASRKAAQWMVSYLR